MVPTSEMDSVLAPKPPQPSPGGDSKATGVEVHDKSNSEMQQRGTTTAGSSATDQPPGASPSEATFIGSLQTRTTETATQGGRDRPLSGASSAITGEPSTGHRQPAAPNPAFVSPNTPIDSSEIQPSFPTTQQLPTTTMATEAPTIDYYEDTAPQFAHVAINPASYQPSQPYAPGSQASTTATPARPEPSQGPPPRRPPVSNAFAQQQQPGGQAQPPPR